MAAAVEGSETAGAGMIAGSAAYAAYSSAYSISGSVTWSTTELLLYHVPVTFLETLPTIAHLFPPFEVVHQGS
jgi:hypothetical protein